MTLHDPIDPSKERAGRWLRVLSRDEFTRMMGAAVEAALIERGELVPGRARMLGRDALRRFAGLVRLRARRVRGVSREDFMRELEKTHGTLVRDRQELKSEISQLEGQVRGAQAAMKGPRLDAAQAAELEIALRRDLEELLGRSASPQALDEILRRERARLERTLEHALATERERVDLLERRLTKLRAAMAEQEREIAELARRAQLDPGVPSIYRDVQGLSLEELEREAKAKLLQLIFEQNLVLQHKA